MCSIPSHATHCALPSFPTRRSSDLLRTVEHLWAIAAVETGAAVPHHELTEIWEAVLLHQFHDILPGSSIAWVHREARATYQDRKSTRLNSSHVAISYAVFCLKKKTS